MTSAVFRGIIPAFPTPLKADGRLDADALHRIIEHQIVNGVAGIVPLGGTGEFASLAPSLRERVIVETVAAVRGRVPIVAGVLNPGFADAVDTAQTFAKAGVDGLMVIPPYYIKPTQDTVIQYFDAFKKAVGLPVVFYDNPLRSHTVVKADTIARLFEIDAICGMKASSLDLYHFDQIMGRVDDRFAMLSGQDTLFTQQVSMGAIGGILTSAALAPDFWNKVQALAEGGDFKAAFTLQRQFNPLMNALFDEDFPASVKAAFTIMGIPSGECLLPLGGVSDALRETLTSELAKARAAGLLPAVMPAVMSA